MDEKNQSYKERIRKLEQQVSELKFDKKEAEEMLAEEKKLHRFYQLIADFTFGWELWIEPGGAIKYCSPSCFDLTGYTANQIIASEGIAKLLVYEPDQQKYTGFLKGSLDQMLVNQTLEFRILTRTKQLRWCMMNVRGVYDKQGKYLGIRATIQDITRLKRAMGHIHEMEAGKEFEQRTRKRMQNELEMKDRELVSFLLQLSHKNEIISKITNQLRVMEKKGMVKNAKEWQKLTELIEKEPFVQPEWDMIENQLEKTNPGFLSRLQTKHPVISPKDKKLCAYLRLGLTSKEISGLQNITPQSVEIARVRLRKKLKISGGTRLANYLSQL